MTREELGAKIKLVRVSKNLTLLDISEQAALSRNTLSRIEAGKFSVNLDTLNKVLEVLDIKLSLNYNGADL